ncbi:hypothetical protein PVAP13_5KG384835 [Panicum virgatum]|uniref:Uncharacterized protein n=1 Tax=Panicum virgatum TaxID=38727 RepID=A0A8T0SP76_PANVG|nr:hypothetical protein PVAP13_5KG384835 [Panicum virgatum]KAG2598879.1 hypothetical protein PVAP13_5KG384835 [Panicum virgatum]KAG2598881.1 hypothetical protein PVAP13_5KG384835 [Panicum virgatum]KAG2598883.1 hypothetical protein PVAP13_5KG384835 [Panicum virgatum]
MVAWTFATSHIFRSHIHSLWYELLSTWWFYEFFTICQPFIPRVSATWPPMGKESQLAPPKNDSGNKNAKKRLKDKTLINLDDGNDGRTAKRLVFESEEDVRLVSALLIHSNNPINGNCKKNESKWKMRRGGRRI